MNDWQEAERRVEKAQELFEQCKWQEALEELRAATAINPYNAAWFFNIGLTLDEMDRLDEAVDAYRRALEIDADDLQAMNHLGQDLLRLGQHEQSLGMFERMEKVDSSFEPSYCNRISVYAEMGEHQKAEEMFYLARLFKEHCPHCYYSMGVSLSARQKYDKAIFCWQKTLDLDESHPGVHVRIGEALRGKGDLELARRHYLIGLRQDPGDIATLLDLGDLLMQMKRLDEAGEKYRCAIELKPDEPAAYFKQGQWLMSAGRDDEAMVAFARALRLDPTYPGAHLHMARLHQRRNHPEQLRKHVRGEIALNPEQPEIVLDLANLLMDLGDSVQAATCLKRLTRNHRGHLAAWQNLAVAQFLCGDFGNGISSCSEVLQVDPHNLMTIYNLALAHQQQQNYSRALYWVRQGLRIEPGDLSLQKLEFRLRVSDIRSRVVRVMRKTLWLRRA